MINLEFLKANAPDVFEEAVSFIDELDSTRCHGEPCPVVPIAEYQKNTIKKWHIDKVNVFLYNFDRIWNRVSWKADPAKNGFKCRNIRITERAK